MWAAVALASGSTLLLAYLTKQSLRPSSDRNGFLIGAFVSQLQPALISSHCLLLVTLRHTFDALPALASAAIVATSATCYLALAYDWTVGWWTPIPAVRTCSTAPSVPLPPLPLSSRLQRLLLSLFPLLALVVIRQRVRRARNIPYTKHGDKAQLLDVLSPRRRRKGDAPLPVVIYVHGGGWVAGNRQHFGSFFMLGMAEDCVLVTIDYRLSKMGVVGGATWPEHIVDVKAAIVWTREHIAEYGGDPKQIIISGGSAGGHLAALAALTPNHPDFQPGFEDKDTSVIACIDIYGVADFADQDGQWKAWDAHHGMTHPDPDKPAIMISFLQKYVLKQRMEHVPQTFLEASPLYHCRRHPAQPCIPFLLVHGTRDNVVPVQESRLLAAALDPEHTTYLEIDGGTHAFDIFPSPRAYAMLHAARLFLRCVQKHSCTCKWTPAPLPAKK